METAKLILTNSFGMCDITTCTSKQDAMDYISGVEKRGGENNRVVSAVILHNDNRQEWIKNGVNLAAATKGIK